MTIIIDEPISLQQFETKDNLCFDKPVQRSVNKMAFWIIPIFRIANGKKLPLIIKGPNNCVRTGLKEFDNEGRLSYSIYFLFGNTQ